MTKKLEVPNISRREILRLGGLAAAWTALTSCTTAQNILEQFSGEGEETSATPTKTSSPSPYSSGLETLPLATPASSLSDDDLILHTLRRMSFGVTPEMVERAKSLGLAAFVDEQLDPYALDTRLVENRVQQLEVMNSTPTSLFQSEQRGRLASEFILATLVRQVRSPRQFYEMVVDFWTNHFNIYLLDGVTGLLKIFDDRDVVRPYALSTFPELLKASTHSPAMLTYLDQAQSRRAAPNENYARELLELHTVGVEGGYTHDDVDELARTLTGWSVTGPREVRQGGAGGQFVFREQIHDPGEKNVLGFRVPAGSGLAGGEDFLDYLATHPKTNHFIAKKLAIRFVADDPPQSIIDSLAATFQSTGGDIKAMLHTLIFSDEFAASAGMKVKRPLEFFNSVLRVTGAEVTVRGGRIRDLQNALKNLGQVPYFWSPPNGYPDFAGWWLTTSGVLNRWNFAMLATTGGLPGVNIPLDRITAAADSPVDVVDVLSLAFLGTALPEDARAVMIDFSSDGDLTDKIPVVAGLILGSPYFQIR